MLKDYLIEWCDQESNHSTEGHCGRHCDNQEYCNHDCDNCLDQVHWYPAYPGRSDYTCLNLLLRYVVRFTNKYSGQIASALQLVNLSSYPFYSIFSIGCGGAPDLMSFEEISYNKSIYYTGYDRNEFWRDIHGVIEEYANNFDSLNVELHRQDIFDVFLEGNPRHQYYNILIIQYLLSHLYNTGQNGGIRQLFKSIISNVLSQRVPNSPFLIIITDVDSINKGRNYWFQFLDMLETAGFYGSAIAKSAFPNSDLGDSRWSYHKDSSCFGNIQYEYIQNESEHEGAQLIIELR